MKKKTQTKSQLGNVIASHIELINKAKANPFLAMAAQAAREEAEKNPNGRQ